MKNKILVFLGIFIVSLSLTACNKDNLEDTNSIDEVSTEYTSIVSTDEEIIPIEKEDLDSSSYSFYSAASVYIEDFNRDYILIGNAVDDRDLNDFNYYLSKMQTNIDNIEKLKEPSSMKEAKKQIIDSLKKFKESAVSLKDAYDEVDYNKYIEYDEIASDASNLMGNFLEYCNNMGDYVTYLSSFMETSFYLSNYTLYYRTSEFSDEENAFLYEISHSLILLSDAIDNSFVNYAEGKDYRANIQEFDDTISSFEDLSIENENLTNFKKELIDDLKIFRDYFEDYFDALETNSLEEQFDKAEDISKNAQRIYDAMSYMQAFYGEHDMSIDFTPTTDYVDVNTSYEIEGNEDGEIEVIGETETIN